MKGIIGLLLIVLGLVAGAYIGVYLMFIRGIIIIVEQCKLDKEHINATIIAFGIARIFFAAMVGGLSAWILIMPGAGLIRSWLKPSYRNRRF